MNQDFIFKRSQLYRDGLSKLSVLHKKIDEIIEANVMESNNNKDNQKRNYVIDQLLKKEYNLSHEEIRDEIYIFILAVSKLIATKI